MSNVRICDLPSFWSHMENVRSLMRLTDRKVYDGPEFEEAERRRDETLAALREETERVEGLA